MNRTNTLSALSFVLVLMTTTMLGGGCKQLGLVSDDDDQTPLLAAALVGPPASSGGDTTPGSSSPTCSLMGGALQPADPACELNLAGTVSTLAGDGTNASTDGTGVAAQLADPTDITTDGENLYFAEFSTNVIRKVVIATGVVTTIAGTVTGGTFADGTGAAARFFRPRGITSDGTNLYVSDLFNRRIRKIVISTSVVTTLAGSGAAGSMDGTGTAAEFTGTFGITTDGTNLYVCDAGNHRIRKIEIATGVVTTLAGSTQGFQDGTGTAARFDAPTGITTDGVNLYVGDLGNYRIRKIVIATGEVTTLAGNGVSASVDGTGTAAQFSGPGHLTSDGTNLYVNDSSTNRVRKIVISTGVVTTLAGSTNGYADGTGTAAQFQAPTGITATTSKLYLVDTTNRRVRVIE